MALKNVLLIGASGNIGKPILEALIEASNINVTILSRKDSSSVFPDGVKVVKADYSSKESLVEAFKGQDVIVSAIVVLEPNTQLAFINAAVEAGVPRFLPSEFGVDTYNPKIAANPILNAKYVVHDYLEKLGNEGKLTWTAPITGPFFDWGLETGFLGFDIKNKKASIWTPGTQKFSATTLKGVGKAIVGIVNHLEETKNRPVKIYDYLTSPNEILALLETKGKYEVTKIDSAVVVPEAIAKLGQGDFSEFGTIIHSFIFGGEEYGAVFDPADSQLLGLIPAPKSISALLEEFA